MCEATESQEVCADDFYMKRVGRDKLGDTLDAVGMAYQFLEDIKCLHPKAEAIAKQIIRDGNY